MFAPNFLVTMPNGYPSYMPVPVPAEVVASQYAGEYPQEVQQLPMFVPMQQQQQQQQTVASNEPDGELYDFIGELMMELPPAPGQEVTSVPPPPPMMVNYPSDPLMLALEPSQTPMTTPQSGDTCPGSPRSTGSHETDDASMVESRKIFYRRSWTREEDEKLIQLVRVHGPTNWTQLATLFKGKNGNQLSQRWHKALDPNIRKGKWTKEEDAILRDAVERMGKKWKAISALIPGRTGKQCRDRFTARLDPALKCTPWTKQEDTAILKAFSVHGNKWATIQKVVPHRSWYRVKWRIETLTKHKRAKEQAL